MWFGVLNVRFAVGSIKCEINLLSKTRNNYDRNLKFAGNYAHISSFKKYTLWYQDHFDFVNVSIFMQKTSISWQQ